MMRRMTDLERMENRADWRALVAGWSVAIIGHLLLFALVLLALAGCAGTPALRPVCPALVTYSAADQKALKAELDAHPELTQVHRWLAGYVGLRDQARVCLKAAG